MVGGFVDYEAYVVESCWVGESVVELIWLLVMLSRHRLTPGRKEKVSLCSGKHTS